MKRIKALILLTISTIALWSCSKDNRSEIPSVVGEWKLENYFGQNASDGVPVEVYIGFSADMTFVSYQRLGGGHYESFSGKYTFSDGVISGVYEDGIPWGGRYGCSVDGDLLTLSLIGDDGIQSVYLRTTIPDTVKKDAEDYATI